MAVIGGGPAGAWCACQLAAAGARVALVDGSHPREKPCGGGVTQRALAVVGQAASDEGAVGVDSAMFAYGQAQLEMPLAAAGRPPRLAVFSRRAFDGRLVEQAAAQGATLVAESAVDVSRDGGGWAIKTRPPGQPPRTLHASWLVGADGPGSMVRKRVWRPFQREDLSIACGHFVHGVTSRRIQVWFEDAPAGYLWSFPRPDHVAVGMCAQADVATVATLMPIVERWIATHVTGGTLERYSWPIPSLRAATLERERAAGDRWLLAGDAAGLVDPITREGIFFALESGAAAASSIVAGTDSAHRYTERLRDTIYAELTLAARIKARFYRPAFMALLLTALQRSDRIRTIMADLVAGEQPYATLRRRLLTTCEWKLAMELFVRRR